MNQSYCDVECVVIDDGSTDETNQILTPLIANKLISYYHKRNQGVSSARNVGIEKSNGNYLLFLDGDDLLAGGALQFLIRDICEYDIIFGSWMDFDKDISSTHQYSETKVNNQLTKYLIYKPTVSTALIKKEVIIDWDTTKKVWEVTDYFLTLILKNSKIKFSDRIVTKIRQHDNPSRASLLQDHFNPMQTLTFLKQWKERIKDKGMLDSEVEARIDTEIINNIYT
ncbi:MAG: glycosyltransferase, partial [Pedobacter sp.]